MKVEIKRTQAYFIGAKLLYDSLFVFRCNPWTRRGGGGHVHGHSVLRAGRQVSRHSQVTTSKTNLCSCRFRFPSSKFNMNFLQNYVSKLRYYKNIKLYILIVPSVQYTVCPKCLGPLYINILYKMGHRNIGYSTFVRVGGGL